MTAVGKAALAAQPPTVCCLLPSGEICVTQEPSHQLLILTLSGELRNVVDAEGSLLSFPTGVACDAEHMYVTDGMRDRVHQLSVRRGFKPTACSLGGDGRGARLHYPHGSCLIDPPSGGGALLFVADWGNHRILALDAGSGPDALAVKFSFGRKGRQPGQLMYPRNVAGRWPPPPPAILALLSPHAPLCQISPAALTTPPHAFAPPPTIPPLCVRHDSPSRRHSSHLRH